MFEKMQPFFLVALFVLLYIVPLQTRPLFSPDETRYAEVPREMLASGDMVVPRINGLDYFEKPVMGYWLSAASLLIFGENNFAVRLPSAIAAGLTALLIYLLCSQAAKDRHLQFLAVLIFLTSLGTAAIGTFAVLDFPLTLFLTATLVFFFFGTEKQPGSTEEKLLLFAAGLCAGCAFLIKGFLAFVVPVLTVAPYLCMQKRWTDTIRMLWMPFAGALLVSLPWAVLIHLREPDFWNYFFWNEHVRRFLSDSAQHSQPFYYFLLVLPAMFIPWTFLIPAYWHGMRQKESATGRRKRMLQYCLCWFLLPFFFFSISKGKLITYILPCFPPLAILMSHGLEWWLSPGSQEKKHLQSAIVFYLFLGCIALVSLTALQVSYAHQLKLFQYTWKWLLLIEGITSLILLLVIARATRSSIYKVTLFGLSFAVLLFSAHFAIPDIALKINDPGRIIRLHVKDITKDMIVLSGEDMIRAVCWNLGRDDVYLVENAGELEYGLHHDDAMYRKLGLVQARVLLKKHKGRAVLITGIEEYKRWHSFLPQPYAVDSTGTKGYMIAFY
ncbi:phospholipid carrier-dependent glycosyltransferase [Desulfogranum japonicum]|uniref:phospholipid carrier-dependent glycosyltransferase n=1 Tax=Desulfogranum japonicum TaxID=231447 RepID=UPI0004274D5B|nr:phospholipid carrier-dependent glycosyltransferase [Desulfogranum japonicum]